MTVNLKMSTITLRSQGLRPRSPSLPVFTRSFLKCQHHFVRAEVGPAWRLLPTHLCINSREDSVGRGRGSFQQRRGCEVLLELAGVEREEIFRPLLSARAKSDTSKDWTLGVTARIAEVLGVKNNLLPCDGQEKEGWEGEDEIEK